MNGSAAVLQGANEDLGNREALIDSYLGQRSLADVAGHTVGQD
ncbi:hypothetical protein ABZS66_11760 [Dactylosporangium sp. NPDC005572]